MGRRLRLKELELFIQSIPGFREPKVELEQYATPSTIAARILWLAETVYGDIHSKIVLDLGAGTGRLGLGAVFLGCRRAILVDVDLEALTAARRNALRRGMYGETDFIVADAALLPLREGVADTVVENPPFGVHRRGADMVFLRAAVRMGEVVYTVHKASTLSYVARKAVEYGCGVVEKIVEDKICIPNIFPFHVKRAHCVDIVVLRLDCKGACDE